MKVVVVIPMYGQEEYTRRCIDFVVKNSGVPFVDILVVDDGSKNIFTDDRAFIIRLDKNSGFTAAVNAGILWAQDIGYDYVMLLNNDTEPCKDFLKLLVDQMKPGVGITGSIRLHPKKEVEKVAICGSDLIRGMQYFKEEDDMPPAPFDCNIIPFASVLLRMDMVREIGLLDKKYKNHCSDTEYCLRAKINNWRVVMVPESKVLHHLSVTTTANNILVDDDQRIWLEKLAGLDMAKIMAAMPLDGEAGTWGQLEFSVYKK